MEGKTKAACELVVSGDVQRVGCRRIVQRAAWQLAIAGYVENQPDGRVRIIAEGEDKKLSEFIGMISIDEPPVHVAKVDKKPRRVTGRHGGFIVKAGTLVEELQEGLGSAEEQLRTFRGEFGEYRGEFKDFRGDFDEYRGEFRNFRSDFDEYRGEFKDFKGETKDNFKRLDDKYGEISEKLTTAINTFQAESLRTREELVRAVDNLARLVDEFIKRGASPQSS